MRDFLIVKKTMVGFAILLSAATAHSEGSRLTDEQLDELPRSTKKLILQIRDVMNNGGRGIKVVSFKDSDYKFAITAIYHGATDEPSMHLANISSDGDGASISFKIYRKCNVTRREESLLNRVIRVDGTNISTVVGCGTEPGKPSMTQEVFLLKTPAGRDYVYKQFAENPFVFVDFGGGEIPFDTDGFDEIWKRTNEPAL
ncbi:hypothetical protein [Thauera sp.]|uniref:hypothetical protein n=1 Tax=Thauera sp. TaxID=1905334 RepID=UPI00258ECA5D|nr:hypothetical protein [Thauera sp.]HNS92020.1 hypothetical protein [Thauera sp.]